MCSTWQLWTQAFYCTPLALNNETQKPSLASLHKVWRVGPSFCIFKDAVQQCHEKVTTAWNSPPSPTKSKAVKCGNKEEQQQKLNPTDADWLESFIMTILKPEHSGVDLYPGDIRLRAILTEVSVFFTSLLKRMLGFYRPLQILNYPPLTVIFQSYSRIHNLSSWNNVVK